MFSEGKPRECCCGCQAGDTRADYKPLMMRQLHRPGNRGPCGIQISRCTYFCVVLAALTVVGLVHALIVRATLDVRCVKTADIDRMMPESPSLLSAPWRGVIWMDQGGSYGSSDLSEGSGSLAMSFGDAIVDDERRTARVSNTGASWSVENNPSGYLRYFSTAVLRYSYFFEFSEDYRSAQIYPSVQPLDGWLGTWYVPKALMSFTMEVRNTSRSRCPPPDSASKEEITRCAMFDRITTYFDLFPPVSRWLGTFHYPAFEIVDPSGQRQPSYKAYDRFAATTANPSPFFAWLFLGIDLQSSGCNRSATVLLARDEFQTVSGAL
uniref:Uncharacterized protein n=1 Tax=Alexandrium monilatum TaxID=311494 RepID=A0A7S4QFJ3_9DINO|mmetsp:Transcript_6998/g.21239  ORF Transcript_6998/g.21239 Transcript_6998/m.21239 type:complete len:323 (-) Transcript_6998:100-1068(-)